MLEPGTRRAGVPVIMVAILAVLAACHESQVGPPHGAAALSGPTMSVTSSGAFLHHPQPGAHAEILPDRATQLAEAWADEFGPLLKDYWEHERGGPIEFGQLHACGSATYAATPLQDLGPSMPAAVRRAVGPWWLVTLCAGGVPEMSVAVSAWDTGLKITNGHLLELTGDDFIPRAIPLTMPNADVFLVTPQRAVAMAKQTTLGVAATPPELVMQPFVMPQFARWRVRLDSAASVRLSTGSLVHRSEVYVGGYAPGHDGGVSVAAAPSQSRQTVELRYYSSLNTLSTVTARVRSGYSLDTEVAVRKGDTSK